MQNFMIKTLLVSSFILGASSAHSKSSLPGFPEVVSDVMELLGTPDDLEQNYFLGGREEGTNERCILEVHNFQWDDGEFRVNIELYLPDQRPALGLNWFGHARFVQRFRIQSGPNESKRLDSFAVDSNELSLQVSFLPTEENKTQSRLPSHSLNIEFDSDPESLEAGVIIRKVAIENRFPKKWWGFETDRMACHFQPRQRLPAVEYSPY